jgi:hypothetical protein
MTDLEKLKADMDAKREAYAVAYAAWGAAADTYSAAYEAALAAQEQERQINKVQAVWNDFICDSRGCYLVNDPKITFIDHEEAAAYCDEHNRALAGQAALRERVAIVADLRAMSALYSTGLPSALAARYETGEHLAAQEKETPNE